MRSTGICCVSLYSPGIVGLCAALDRILLAAVVLCFARVATSTLLLLRHEQHVSAGRNRSAIRDSVQQVAKQIAKRGNIPGTLALDDMRRASRSLGLGKQGIRSRGDLLHPQKSQAGSVVAAARVFLFGDSAIHRNLESSRVSLAERRSA